MENNNTHLDNFKKALGTKQVTEKITGFTYVSWSDAWESFKKIYPLATYEIVKFDGLPYQDLGIKGVMVYTKVTADGITYEMWLPVLDGANKPMKNEPYKYEGYEWENGAKKPVEKTCDAYDIFDVNTAIMRCLTKNIALFGIGLYAYQGVDLPKVVNTVDNLPPVKKAVAPVAPTPKVTASVEGQWKPTTLPSIAVEPVALSFKDNEVVEGVGQVASLLNPPTTSTQEEYDKALARAIAGEVKLKPVSIGRKKLNDLLDKHLAYSVDKLKLADEKKTLSILSSQKLGYAEADDVKQQARLTWISGVLGVVTK